MKIKQDFVTNSSSTAFIISMNKPWSQENFLNAIGLEGKSPMNKLFEQLYEAINSDKCEIKQYMKRWAPDCSNVSDFLRKEGFCEETILVTEQLIDSGRTVYYGKLSSDGETAAEVFFCCESFLVCDDNLYFNGRISGW